METRKSPQFDQKFAEDTIDNLAFSLEHGSADEAAHYVQELKGVLAVAEQQIREIRRPLLDYEHAIMSYLRTHTGLGADRDTLARDLRFDTRFSMPAFLAVLHRMVRDGVLIEVGHPVTPRYWLTEDRKRLLVQQRESIRSRRLRNEADVMLRDKE